VRNILVTGGAGFIGSHLAEYLLNQGWNVVVLDDLSGGFIENVNGNCIFVKGSILDVSLVDKIFDKYRFSIVYHLSAYAAEGLSHFIKRFNYQNNLIGSVNLINAAVKYGTECFVFTSSMAVYGSSQVPFDESMKPSPEDSYGIAKYAVEQELAISKEMFGLDYVIFRPHNVIGMRQNIGDPYRNVVGIFMNKILMGQAMSIYGDGEQSRAFSYVSDIVPVIADSTLIPSARGQIFNIGGDVPCTINELTYLVAEAMGVKRSVVYLEERREVKYAYCSHHRAEEVFNYEPKTSLRDGIFLMAEWAKKHGSRRGKDFEGIEITKNLPSFWVRTI
jgi:UDP-glucose 4-epimerase